MLEEKLITKDVDFWEPEDVTINRQAKDRVFTMLFSTKEAPERQFLRLSDAYYKVDDRQNGIFAPDDVSLELVTMVININHGCNDSIKSRSPLLEQYGEFVDMIHQFQREVPIQEATKLAIDYCIKNGILKEFLEKERDAVMSNILYEYDEQETLAYIAEERYGAGVEYGRTEGELCQLINLVKKKMAKSKTIDVIADELECNLDEIVEIYDVVMQCGVESSVEEIISHLSAKSEQLQAEYLV